MVAYTPPKNPNMTMEKTETMKIIYWFEKDKHLKM